MTNRERECRTLSFEQMQGRGAVEETFYPWVLTTERFIQEGMPGEIARGAVDITNDRKKGQENPAEKYLAVSWGKGLWNMSITWGLILCGGFILCCPSAGWRDRRRANR